MAFSTIGLKLWLVSEKEPQEQKPTLEQGRTNEPESRQLLVAWNTAVILGLLNFLIFVTVACYLGGDALNGKVEEGRYYLFGVRAVAGRKVYTEVSAPVFLYSKWHAYSVLISWPFVMVAAYAANRLRKRSRRKS